MPETTATQSHPNGCYYVNIASGTIQRQCNPLLAVALAGAGFFGTGGTPADATNAFPTFADAQHFAATQSGSAFSGDVSSAAQAPLTGVNAIGDFFHRLTESATWIRVGEVVGGLLLLYIGLNAVMRGTAAGNAVKSTTSRVKTTVKAVATK